jgi:signal transduction histidine kinase
VTLARRRALAYVLLMTALAVAAVLVHGRPGWSGPSLHPILETIATTIAFSLGVLALVRFYSKKNNVFLFLGTGFLGTAVIDAYHAVASGRLVGGGPAGPDTSSWLASRAFLAFFLCLNWIGWRRERVMGPAGRVGERPIYILTALLAGATILGLRVWGTSATAPPSLELVPAYLFLLALAGYLVKAHWRDNAFDHWLVISLVISLGADGFLMPFAGSPQGAAFELAHALKLVGYLCVGTGLLISVYSTFRQAEESTAALMREVAERERAQEAAEAATRAKSAFLATMSHELRTPLNSIIGFANILRKNRGGRLEEQELQFLERVQGSGLHLLSLINEVLDLSKVEAGKMEVDLQTISLEELVQEVVEQSRGQVADPSVRLIARVPPGLAPFTTDRGKLKQILFNLVGNAIKFTPDGSVTVEVGADGSGRRPTHIDVVDTGIGIPPEKREAIFEAFEQAETGTARGYGGTGLGLTISRSLARLLGYRLALESAAGRGSRFRIVLSPEVDSGTELAPLEEKRAGPGHGTPGGPGTERVIP